MKKKYVFLILLVIILLIICIFYIKNNTLTTPPAQTNLQLEEQRRQLKERLKASNPEKTTIIELEMVFVQGGTFTMGCTSEQGKDCDDDEKNIHEVTVGDFYISKYETVQGQWKAIMGNNPSHFTKGYNYPVEQVSWFDIVGTTGASTVISGVRYYEDGFIYKLNKLTGKLYRLPTEAEWEFAARGGTRSKGFRYSGGNMLDSVGWFVENSEKSTHPIGAKSPNELGLYDMSGNVWEWCSDWFSSDYYTNSPHNNPTGPVTGSDRVFRGGCIFFYARYARISFRNSGNPGLRHINVGFRLASN